MRPVFSARVCEYALWWRQFLQFQSTCSIMILFYVQMSLEYVRLQALHGFLETNAHIYITAVTLVYWLRMSSWRFNIGCMSWDLFLKFISVLAINLFLHAFHWSSWKTFFCCYETRGYNLQKQTNQYIDKVTQTYQPNVRYRKHFNM